MASTSSTKSLLGLLSQRKPVALQFAQDRPFDTLASFGPALGTEGANLSNNALGRLMQQQQLSSDQSIANTEASAEQLKSLLSNFDKLSPGLRATAVAGNPQLLQALGGHAMPPQALQELLQATAGMETAIAGAEGMNELGSGVDKLRQGGVHTSVPGIQNFLDYLGGNSSGFREGLPTGAETAGALTGKTVTERNTLGPDGRPMTIREEDERPTRAGDDTLPSGASAEAATAGPTLFGQPTRVVIRDGAPVVQLVDPKSGRVTHELSPGAVDDLKAAFPNAQ